MMLRNTMKLEGTSMIQIVAVEFTDFEALIMKKEQWRKEANALYKQQNVIAAYLLSTTDSEMTFLEHVLGLGADKLDSFGSLLWLNANRLGSCHCKSLKLVLP